MIRETHLTSLIIVLALLVPTCAWAFDEPFLFTLATKAAILGLAGVGLNLALGLGGLVSLGHAAFFGLGGYAMGILAFHAQTYAPLTEWPLLINGTKSMPVIWLVAMMVAGLVAAAIGALSLRTSGVYFIMITLAFSQMLYYFTISWPAYGGEDGLSIYLRNSFPGLNTLDPMQFCLLVYAVLGVTLLIWARIAASPFGLALSATRQSPARVETSAVRAHRLRLWAFVMSGIITGLAGALYADLNRFVSPTMFSWHLSGELIVFIILGGTGRLMGPVLGAALYVLLEELLGGISDFWQIGLGLILLAVVLYAPGGVLGLLTRKEPRHD